MKKLVINISVLLLISNLQAQDKPKDMRLALVKDYHMMFERIGQKRVGVSEKNIESVKPPFVRLKKKTKDTKTIIKKDGTKVAVRASDVLQAIVNDHVKVSGKWYKLHDNIHGYTLVKISTNAIDLKNENGNKRLSLRNKNEKITIK